MTNHPILLDKTPEEGYIIAINNDPGGLNGMILTGQSGPPCTIEVAQATQPGVDPVFSPVVFPLTLKPGILLRFLKQEAGNYLTVINVVGGEPVTNINVNLEQNGTLSSSDAYVATNGLLTTDKEILVDSNGLMYTEVETTNQPTEPIGGVT